ALCRSGDETARPGAEGADRCPLSDRVDQGSPAACAAGWPRRQGSGLAERSPECQLERAREAQSGAPKKGGIMSSNGHRYDVGGVLLERPFKIRRLGHFGFNINKLAEAREFYGDLLGFTVSDKADFSGAPWFPKDKGLGEAHGYFMRYGSDHHAMVLFSKPVMDVR